MPTPILLAPDWCAGLVAGLVPLVFGLFVTFMQIRPRRWVKVLGVVTRNDTQIGHVRYGVVFTPIVEYEYLFENKRYTSTRRSFGNYAGGSRDDANAILNQYPVGKEVMVFVNPRRPKKAVLEYGVSAAPVITAIFGAIIVAVVLAYNF